MIAQHTRDQLRAQIRSGDWEKAAQIYEKNVSRPIYPRYLQKFIEGDKNPTGRNPRNHSPSQMFAAVAQAIQERQQREHEANQAAQKLLQTILRDTKPTQPIAL